MSGNVETCRSCGGVFTPADGVVPILKCEGCGRELPGTALPKMTAADYQDGEVLEYFAREGRGLDNSPKPLAGLKLETFRKVRARLVEQGRLVRTAAGRYVPVSETRP